MSLVDETNGYLDEIRVFADSINMREQLEDRLAYLRDYAKHRTTRCKLWRDWAPKSFRFMIEVLKEGVWRRWFNGGLIFHGAHDHGRRN